MYPFIFREPVSAASHLLWLLIGIPAFLFLIKLSKNSVSIIIYAISYMLCYGASALFHSVFSKIELCEEIDHVCIFTLIAGTYTPLLIFYKEKILLSILWVLTCACMMHRVFTNKHIEELYPAIAILPLMYPPATRLLFQPLIIVGNLFYLTGCGIQYYKYPVLIPRIVGYHELFHLFVMAGSTSHFIFIFKRTLQIRVSKEGKVHDVSRSIGGLSNNF